MDVSTATPLCCAACQAALHPGDRFCEQCGARLADLEPDGEACRACGAADAIDTDGYCSVCGTRARTATQRTELDFQLAATISDRGLVHHRNEDSCRLEIVGDGRVAAVVCDGISSASAGDVAARKAAEVAVEVLAGALAQPDSDLVAATEDAVGAARSAVGLVPWTTRQGRDMPSCTLVSALCRAGEIVVGSVGDSRAYWLADGTARQLTTDDSWAQEQVAEGRLSAEEARRDRRAHTITNWIGPDAPARPPQIASLRPDTRGRLLLCTDGLWNYLADASGLVELVGALPPEASAAAVARALTDMAVSRGGRDNITVAIIDVDPSPGATDEPIHD